MLDWFVNVQPDEIRPLLAAFCTFLCVLGSYFVQLPLRDELGITIGTSWLPSLFIASLIVTGIAAPLTSKYLSQDTSYRIQKFYSFIWTVLLLFWISFVMTQRNQLQDKINHSLVPIQVTLYCGFYLWVGVQNVLCISTLWAKCADVFPNDAAKRLFGFISAGSTLGQLVGSFLAKIQIQLLSSTGTTPPFHLVLSAASLMVFASVLIQYIDKTSHEVKERVPRGLSSSKLLDGFNLILKSRYLLVICLYFVLNYAMASQFYFQKSLIVAKTLKNSSQRTSWFAQLNLYSGVITFILQLTLTGKLLSWCDFRVALFVTPCLCSIGMCMVTLMSTPLIIGLADVMRKLVTYALARPARETLFTVLEREEKYKAKLIIDAIVQRTGDVFGAAVFHLAQTMFTESSSSLAMVLGIGWAIVSWNLGRIHLQRTFENHARSVLQSTSSLPEVDCRLTSRELRRYSGDEKGQWVLNDSGLSALNGDIQRLINCTEDGDMIFFGVEDPVQPASRIVIYWNLTLSAFVQGSRDENGIFPRAGRKVVFVCPRDNEGVFLVEANESLFANFMFRNCSLNHGTGEEQYGLITTRNCSTSRNLGTIAFYHIDFEANFLNASAALLVQEPSCSVIEIVDVSFHNNTCVGVCAASLSTWNEIQNMSLNMNQFLDKDVRTPTLIRIHSGSNATIDGLFASENDGTVVYVQNATMRISNSYIYKNSGGRSQIEDYPGGVAFVQASGQILDSQFEANTGTTGSSIDVRNSSCVIERTSVTRSESTGQGGGISSLFGANVQILDSVIANNSAVSHGGGIYSIRTASLIFENTIIEMNRAEAGGGIYSREGDLKITRSNFQSNMATKDGAGLFFTNGLLTIGESSVANNSADSYGGGWYIDHSTYNLVSLRLIQNKATYGGGLVILESSGSLNNSHFEGNSATSDGGGLYSERTNFPIIHNCTFLNNSAYRGGGVYGDTLILDNLLSSYFTRNLATTTGGGAYFNAGVYVLENNSFEENESMGSGGGLACRYSTLNVNDTRFVENRAGVSGAGSYVGGTTYGGFTNCTWSRNNAVKFGAGSFIESGSQFLIISSNFSHNEAESGAGVFVSEANVTLIDSIGSHNKVSSLGSALSLQRSNGTLSNCSFAKNSAVFGGALALQASTTQVSASMFSSNAASENGGALRLTDSSNLTIQDCSFSFNSASDSGGAWALGQSSAFATNIQFENNSAGSYGGAILAYYNSFIQLSNSTFHNEVSQRNGGAISGSEAELRLRGITIHNCSTYSGGGIFLIRSSVNINETSVSLCKALESGGGIRLIQSNLISNGLNISLNTAVGIPGSQSYGGGVNMDTFSRLHIRNATLTGNRAHLGAGVSSRGKCIVKVSDGHFYNNSAALNGGVAYIGDSSLTLEDVVFEKNSAFAGGSLYSYNSNLTVNNSQIIDSSSTDAGGSIFARQRSIFVIQGTTIKTSIADTGGGIMLEESYFRGLRVQFTGCQARLHGGGVNLNETSSFLCVDCVFQGNIAIKEGGAIRLTSPEPQLLAFQLDNCQFYNNTADFGGGIHFQTRDGSADCLDAYSTACTFLALTRCDFVNNYANFSGGAILANNPSAIRFSCNVSNKTDPFAYYSQKELEKLTKLESLDVFCDNWARNNASIYGPVVGSYARRVSTSISFMDNKTVEIPGNHYMLKNHQSGTPLPIINLEAADEYNQGPALVQGNEVLRAEMTSPDRLFDGIFIVAMENSRGSFQGITGFKEPGTYNIQIEFSEGGMPTLIIAVEIRHCVIGESRAANGTLCEPCSGATYNFYPRSKDKTCIPCPENAKCDSVAIQPKEGFWHQTPCSIHIQECLSETACKYQNREDSLIQLGSKIQDCEFDDDFVGKYSKAVCRKGYTGPLCGSCTESYGKSRSFSCERCYGRFANGFLVALVALMFLGLTGFTIRSSLPAHKHLVRRNQPMHEGPSSPPVNIDMVEMLVTGIVPQELIYPHLRMKESTANTVVSQQQRQRNAELAKWKAVEIFKITINYLQVIAIAIAVNVAWTSAIIYLFETAEFIGGVTSEAATRSTDCLISADSSVPRSAVRTIVDLIIPAVVIRCSLSAMVVSYLSYIAITKTSVNILYCVRVHDSWELDDDSTTLYWAADTVLKCYKGTHTILASVFGWPVLILFSFGFPAFVAYILIRERTPEGIDSPWLFETTGFLYRSYDPKFIFWESMILLRKALLAVIVVFAYPLGGNLQGLLAVCVLTIALYFQTLCRPYRLEFALLNQLEGLSLLISSLTFVSGLFFNDHRTSEAARAAITVFLILANVGTFTYFMFSFIVAGTKYLKVVLDNEGTPYDENVGSINIIKTYLKSRIEVHLGPALKRLGFIRSRPPQQFSRLEMQVKLERRE
eukprot:g3986.t1